MPTVEQDLMKDQWTQREREEHLKQLETSYLTRHSFKNKLKNAFESGLLLFAKYALVLFLSYIALQFLTSIISGSQNGTNAVLYLNELQNKGYLPKVVNGSVPTKVDNVGTTNAKP